MKERPILFSAPMVRAILASTKTQTRRVLPTMNTMGRVEYPGRRDKSGYSRVNFLDTPEGIDAAARECRYGQPGDRLWVRETWAGPLVPMGQWEEAESPAEFERPEFCRYAADGGPAPEFLDADENMQQRWTPSIHMPRWASRITLEIVGVRVERLQEISKADAGAEGLHQDQAGRWTTWSATAKHREHLNPVEAYRDLWESINGPGSWDETPWVWVVEFKRIEA